MENTSLETALRGLLEKQPRYPISLLPTPLQELPRFSDALGGPRIFIKRDDMTGLAYGGNKARKLDYFIGEAVDQGCDVFLGGGGAVQSNHAVMCAAAARKAGLKPVIFARTGTKHYELQGDFLLTKLLVDAGVYLYQPAENDGKVRHRPELPDLMNRVADELRAQGHKPYILPGSGQPAGTLGYVECALELTEQCNALGIEPNWIFMTSTGGGQAGLLVGTRFLQQNQTVVGVAPAPYGTDQSRAATVADLANRTARLLGANVQVDPEEVTNLNYGGEAYGVPTTAGLEAFRLMAHTEGLFLDPVYTSKSMSGLVDQIRQGRVGPDDTVVYIHTGGLPLNFAYSRELSEAFEVTCDTDELLS